MSIITAIWHDGTSGLDLSDVGYVAMKLLLDHISVSCTSIIHSVFGDWRGGNHLHVGTGVVVRLFPFLNCCYL